MEIALNGILNCYINGYEQAAEESRCSEGKDKQIRDWPSDEEIRQGALSILCRLAETNIKTWLNLVGTPDYFGFSKRGKRGIVKIW